MVSFLSQWVSVVFVLVVFLNGGGLLDGSQWCLGSGFVSVGLGGVSEV